MNKNVLYLFTIVLVMFYLTNIQIAVESMSTTLIANDNIDFNYTLNNGVGGKRNVFIPIYEANTYEDVVRYCEKLKVVGEFSETDTYYKMANKDTKEEVYIYKNIDAIRYLNYSKKSKVKVDKFDAIDIANDFLNEHKFKVNFDEIVVKIKDDNYYIYYISKLDNMKNYSFLTSFKIDKFGNILEFNYYHMKYKKISSIDILNEKEAFNILEQNYTGEQVSINKSEMVYMYTNSIMSPTYLFTGEMTTGEEVEIFIDAIK